MIKNILSFLVFFGALSGSEMREFISPYVPMREDGKINIPEYIKHVKLDIGLSYHAPMAYNWLVNEKDLFVFGFEPNPKSVEIISNGGPSPLFPVIDRKYMKTRFFLIPCALGAEEDKMAPFYITKEDCGCSSLHSPKEFEVERVVNVPVFTLSNFFDLFPFDTHPVIEYIKLDAQGADLDIIKSAGDYLRQRVVYVTIEANNNQYENTNNSLESINKFMEQMHFIPDTSNNYTEDPTFINTRFLSYAKQHNIRIYQGPPVLE